MAVAEKISELTALTTPAAGDLLCIVDVSDTTHSSDGTTKKITQTNYFGKIPSMLMCLGDTANAEMTVGLTLNQGANDNEILALKSSDVAHGVTDIAETDTFGVFKKRQGTSGGLMVYGLKDADGDAYGAFEFAGYLAEAADTTKSGVGKAIYQNGAYQTSGASVTNVAADSNLWNLMTYIGGAYRSVAIIDAEGELHTDAVIGVGDDWDEWDDLALASDLSRLPKAKFDEMMKYKAEDFERAGLLTLSTDEDGNQHAFLRHKAMLQFAMCCFAEVAQRMRRYEQALLSLGVEPQLLQEAI